MTDGLALLTQQREQRKRSIPPPRHPARPVVRSVPDRVSEAAPESAPAPRDAAENPPQNAPAAPAEPTLADLTELYRSTIYFGQAEDRFLEDVRTVARRAKPKVDATRSAVVRLAVKRMLSDLTPEQVVDELRAQAPPNTGTPGRRRL